MAIPAVPTVTTIVTQALKRAGRTTPTQTQIDEAIDHALQEVKADIMLVADTHSNLLVTATTVTVRGQQRYAFPQDYNKPYSMVLLDGPEDWKGTVVNASTRGITFPPTLLVGEDEIEGKYVIITDGPGVEQYRQILTYDESLRLAGLDLDWGTIPTSDSGFTIVADYLPLRKVSTAYTFDKIQSMTQLGRPVAVTEFSQEYQVYPTPDLSSYGLLVRYYVDMSKLDETGLLFLQLLREWRSLWIQGVAVKSMQRFDEDRYQSELGIYNFMLTALANQTCQVSPVQFEDV